MNVLVLAQLRVLRGHLVAQRQPGSIKLSWQDDVLPQLRHAAMVLEHKSLQEQVERLTRRRYCDTTSCVCSMPGVTCPSPHCCECQECGRGEQDSWGIRCNDSVCGSSGDTGSMICLTFIGAGYFCYIYQCLLSPFVSWDCQRAGCDTSSFACRCCACGCPLSVTGSFDSAIVLVDTMLAFMASTSTSSSSRSFGNVHEPSAPSLPPPMYQSMEGV
jgi:hypothetical protein